MAGVGEQQKDEQITVFVSQILLLLLEKKEMHIWQSSILLLGGIS